MILEKHNENDIESWARFYSHAWRRVHLSVGHGRGGMYTSYALSGLVQDIVSIVRMKDEKLARAAQSLVAARNTLTCYFNFRIGTAARQCILRGCYMPFYVVRSVLAEVGRAIVPNTLLSTLYTLYSQLLGVAQVQCDAPFSVHIA